MSDGDTLLRLAVWLAVVSAEAAAAPFEQAPVLPLPGTGLQGTGGPAAPVEIRSVVGTAR